MDWMTHHNKFPHQGLLLSMLVAGFLIELPGLRLAGAEEPRRQPETSMIPTQGQLLFHRYSSYDAWDGQLFLYDFTTKTLQHLSQHWSIDHAMNAHFSPDGRQIVFMGVPAGSHESKSWDLYLWKLGSSDAPKNLTEGNGRRDEDPKFSPDGRAIVFKQDGAIRLIDLGGTHLRPFADLTPDTEWSMPIFTTDGKRIAVMQGAGGTADLFLIEPGRRPPFPMAAIPKVQEYYPVTWDANRILYVRWKSADDHHDQIYHYQIPKQTSEILPFSKPDANDSDPWPIDARKIFFSSTRSGGKGGYDLWIGDATTGEAVPITVDGINTRSEELGACFWKARSSQSSRD